MAALPFMGATAGQWAKVGVVQWMAQQRMSCSADITNFADRSMNPTCPGYYLRISPEAPIEQRSGDYVGVSARHGWAAGSHAYRIRGIGRWRPAA
jgi:hypothetical protein